MIAFWVVAGVLSAAAAGLILQSAARAAAHAGSEDPTQALYRRQLSEIDDLADRGLIPEAERKSAHAEAARRLLSAADAVSAPWSGGNRFRRLALALAALTPPLAVVLYLITGAPGLPDQPLKARVAAWRQADPATLTPPELAAVLKATIAERPKDPEGYRYLALMEGASGNASGAARALRRAIQIAPQRADLWEMLGEALLVEGEGDLTPQARQAFQEALKRDPKSVVARFHLARAEVMSGDRAKGLTAWRAILADLPAADPRRAELQSAIAQAEGQPAPAIAPDQMAAIRGMVEGLAQRLQASPDDAEGWVRLVRAYAVLGETAKRDQALTQAKARYAGKAEILDQLDAAARTEPMK
jgi:cytochrome c-type biogenesis protein CcmH